MGNCTAPESGEDPQLTKEFDDDTLPRAEPDAPDPKEPGEGFAEPTEFADEPPREAAPAVVSKDSEDQSADDHQKQKQKIKKEPDAPPKEATPAVPSKDNAGRSADVHQWHKQSIKKEADAPQDQSLEGQLQRLQEAFEAKKMHPEAKFMSKLNKAMKDPKVLHTSTIRVRVRNPHQLLIDTRHAQADIVQSGYDELKRLLMQCKGEHLLDEATMVEGVIATIKPILDDLRPDVDPAHKEILDLMDQSVKALEGTPSGEKVAHFRAVFENPSNSDVTPTWQGLQGLSQEVMDTGNVQQCQALQTLAKKVRGRAGKYG